RNALSWHWSRRDEDGRRLFLVGKRRRHIDKLWCGRNVERRRWRPCARRTIRRPRAHGGLSLVGTMRIEHGKKRHGEKQCDCRDDHSWDILAWQPNCRPNSSFARIVRAK